MQSFSFRSVLYSNIRTQFDLAITVCALTTPPPTPGLFHKNITLSMHLLYFTIIFLAEFMRSFCQIIIHIVLGHLCPGLWDICCILTLDSRVHCNIVLQLSIALLSTYVTCSCIFGLCRWGGGLQVWEYFDESLITTITILCVIKILVKGFNTPN